MQRNEKKIFFDFYFYIIRMLKITEHLSSFSETKSTGYSSLVFDTKHISFVVSSTAWRLIQKHIANIFDFRFNDLWFNSNNCSASTLNIFANGASIVVPELSLSCCNNVRAAYETKDHFWQKHFPVFLDWRYFLF